MSCQPNKTTYGSVCRPDIPYPQISAESVPSLISNLTYALYGQIGKSVSNGKVVWNVPCDPNNTASIAGFPRKAGEGLLCYILRVLPNLPTNNGGGGGGDLANATTLYPKDYGAKGDGSTDDTIALMRMFDAVVDNDYVAYDFGTGTYKVAWNASQVYPEYPALEGLGNGILQIGARDTDKIYKKMWFLGNGTASIVANQFSRNPILAIRSKGQSLYFQQLNFTRFEHCVTGSVDVQYSQPFFGGDGLFISTEVPYTKVEEIIFDGCTFTNCHRSVTVTSGESSIVTTKYSTDIPYPKPINWGCIGSLEYKSCNFIYPYGSNSVVTAGGGQGTLADSSVQVARFNKCFFDGCVGGILSVSPNGLAVDGIITGTPQQLIIENNCEFNNGGVETVYQESGIRAFSLLPIDFVVPPIRGTVDVGVGQSCYSLGLNTGQKFLISSVTTNEDYPGGADFPFIIQQVLDDNTIRIINDGTALPPVATIVISGTTATITFNAIHNLILADQVTLTGFVADTNSANLNLTNTQVVTIPSTTQITIALPSTNTPTGTVNTSSGKVSVLNGTDVGHPAPVGTTINLSDGRPTACYFYDWNQSSRSVKIEDLKIGGNLISPVTITGKAYAQPAIRIDDTNFSIKHVDITGNAGCLFTSNNTTFTSNLLNNNPFALSGYMYGCSFHLYDNVPTHQFTYGVQCFFYQNIKIEYCDFTVNACSNVSLVQLWALRSWVQYCSFRSSAAAAKVITNPKFGQNSSGVFIGNNGTYPYSSQGVAPRINYCYFYQLNKAIDTSSGQTNRLSLGIKNSTVPYVDTNTYENIYQPVNETLYNSDKTIFGDAYTNV